jgi:hypothetical protein
LKYCCSLLIILSLHNPAFATVAYTWLDDKGQVNFTQRAPVDREAEVVKTRPGPQVGPAESQKAVDQIIEQQNVNSKTNKEAQIKRQQEAERAQTKSKNCDIARDNLKKYQDNPIGLIKGPDGEYDRIDEVERQNRMKQLQQDIQKHCQ